MINDNLRHYSPCSVYVFVTILLLSSKSHWLRVLWQKQLWQMSHYLRCDHYNVLNISLEDELPNKYKSWNLGISLSNSFSFLYPPILYNERYTILQTNWRNMISYQSRWRVHLKVSINTLYVPATLRTALSATSSCNTDNGWYFCHSSRDTLSHSILCFF